MAAGRRRARPAGRLARPAPPIDACSVPTGSAPTGWSPPTSARELLVEERRLFYVACTRARERLVVTAVASPEDDGDQPSRVPRRARRDRRGDRGSACSRPLSLGGLVSELRRTAADPATSPRAARGGGAAPRPAGRRDGRRPGRWCRWPTPRRGGGPGRPAGRSQPLRDPDQPVPMSAEPRSSAFATCPTQWFLAREAGGVTRSHQSANLGEIVHALAQRVADGRARRPADDAASSRSWCTSSAVWDRMEFRTPWARARELERVRAALGPLPRLAPRQPPDRWSASSSSSAPCSTFPTASRCGSTGYADRLELDADGRVVVVDLKTGRYQARPTSRCPTNVQLGLYQLAVDHGAVDGLAGLPDRAEAGGAELVQLGLTATAGPTPSSRPRPRRPTTARSAPLSQSQLAQGRAAAARRAVPRGRRRPLPRLRLRADLPGQERRAGGGPVTSPPPRRPPASCQGRCDAVAASEQQWAAITAPLEPAVVIAGAGSGKTTLMAARVVYLVLTGQVRPDQVLGLTFTTKAASELRARIREALTAAGALGEVEPERRGRARAHGGDVQRLRRRPAHRPRPADRARAGHPGDHRRGALPARRAGGRPLHRARSCSSPTTRRRSIQNLLALDSAMSEHLVGPDDVRQFDAAERAGFVRALAEEQAGKNRKTYLEPVDKAINAIDRRGELLGLVEAYRRLKADLGLMDFSDQIELGARLAADQPDVGVLERDKFRVVLLDEYQDTSVAQAHHAVAALLRPRPGRRPRARGHRGRRPQPGDLRLARRVGLQHPRLRRDVPRRDRHACRRTPSPSTGAPTGGSSRPPTGWPLRSTTRYDAVAPLEPKPEAGDGVVDHRGPRDPPRRARRPWSQACAPRMPDDGSEPWSEIGVLTRDNAHAAEVFDALTDAGVPVEIVGLNGLLRLPEVAEIVAILHLMHDVTSNASLLTLLTGPRWAIGPRDLSLLEPAGGRAGRASGPRSGARVGRPLTSCRSPTASTRPRSPASTTLSPTRATRRTRPRRWSGSGCSRASCGCCASHVGEPLLDIVRRIIDTTGADVELASAVSAAAPARRDNLDLFVRAVADFQAVDGDVTLPALLAYLTAEDDQGNGLDIATPTAADSVKLLTVHRSKGLEWALGVPGRSVRRRASRPTAPGRCGRRRPPCSPRPLRGDAKDLPQLRGYDKRRARRPTAPTPGRTTAPRSCGWGTSPSLAPPTSCRSRRTAGARGPRPSARPSTRRVVRELLASWGEPEPPWRDKPAKGDPNPYADEDPSRPWPPSGPGAEARLTARSGRAGAGRRPRCRGRRSRHGRERPGR